MRLAEREKIDLASVPNSPTRETDLPNIGTCLLESGWRCAHGWHWRSVDPTASSFHLPDEEEEGSLFVALDPLFYSGKLVAVERCEAYAASSGWVIDPKHPQKLWIAKDRSTSSRKAIAK